jgi:hypothetical protein
MLVLSSASAFSKIPLLRVPNWIELMSILLVDMKEKNYPNFYTLTGVMGVLGLMIFFLLAASRLSFWGVKNLSSIELFSF